jgi:phenylacetate-CoA ligase
MLEEVVPRNPFWSRRLAGTPWQSIENVEDLRSLPLLEKSELVADQADHPPYGSNLTYPRTHYSRLHQTSGSTGRPLR